MNLRDLSYVVAVAELGHFGRAAEQCHVSQPALSGQIRKLEDHLGVSLFERTKRRVSLTPAGEEVVDKARQVLQLVSQIEDSARSQSDPLSGELRLGLIPTIAPYLTPSLLPALHHHLPKVDLSLREDMTYVLEQALLDGKVDAAILATDVTHPRLEKIRLYDEPFWIALPNKHALTKQDEVDLDDLKSEDLLLLEDGHCLRDQVLSFCRNGRARSSNICTQQTSLNTILALVGAEAGVTLVPAMSLRGPWVTDSGIAVRKERSGAAKRSITLAFRSSYPKRELLEKLADIICAIVPDTVTPEKR